MYRFRYLGLLLILSCGAMALGLVNAGHVAAKMQRADDACRAQFTRSLGDDSDVVRTRYVDCYREHGGVGQASFLVKAS
jgi:hypothetical protein